MRFVARLLAGLLTLLLVLPASAGGAVPAMYVMRHLNTPAGQADPDLTADGQRNARTLLHWFDGKPLVAIYVSDYRRTRQTVAPLAAARGLTPKIYDPGNTAAVIAAARAEGGPVLIVGHSNTVPDLVAALGGTPPPELAHPDFGEVWTVDGGRTTRERIAR